MTIRTVQSKLNGRVKQLRAALHYPGSARSEFLGLEGIHLIAEACRSNVSLHSIFVAQGYEELLTQPPLAEFRLAETVDAIALPREILNSAVTTENPQPIAALAQPKSWRWPDLLRDAHPLLVVLAGLQDPGNLGAILRSAEAFGACGAVCLPGTVSPWNAKAMRASAGSVFRLPLLPASDAYCFDKLREAGIRTLAAMAHDAEPLNEISLTGPIALVIGSEGSGLSPEIAAQCDVRITIPCPGPVESLNAAVAASVLLYEASRQRRLRERIETEPNE